MEHTSDLVEEGKLIHENSYPQRSGKYEEIEMEGIKVDYYDVKSKTIHEIKKTDKIEEAHEWQLKYYISVFERNGIEGISGLLEYPLMRKTQAVILSDVDRDRIAEIEKDITAIVGSGDCPPLGRKAICRNCSYFEFCHVEEML